MNFKKCKELPYQLLFLPYFNAYLLSYCLPDIKIKWPNDIYHKGAKAGGILCRSEGSTAFCGIGINWGKGETVKIDRDISRVGEGE
jgi:biotin-(acetyl-CoA carboxylase) ligase